MAVISITIIESSEQLVAGFPKTIAIETNIPATVFYTTDGMEPTTMSSVYISAINVPTNILEFTLKVFATNGTDTSAIITNTYSTNILHNTRLPHAPLPHAPLSNLSNNAPQSMYPFGSNSPALVFDYLNNALAGTTVNAPNVPDISYGYDADGNPIGADQPINNYLNIYSTTDRLNRFYDDVGNLPGKVTVIGRRSPLQYTPEESNRSSAMFDAKAMVIFQDVSTDDPTNPPQINPQMFSLENLELAKDGAPLRAAGLDTPSITGSYLRSHYNPRDQTVISYYRDSATNRWIISKQPYAPTQPDPGNLSGMVFPRHDSGAGKVFTWNLFKYRTLT